MNEKDRIRVSKFLSLVLRHQPDAIGLELDEAGWVPLAELLDRATASGRRLSRDDVREVVQRCEKQRFALSEDGSRIRANQGHSVSVDLGYLEQEPPSLLYHGTVSRSLEIIKKSGLLKMQRHHVHLSIDIPTATNVGARRGKPIILTVDAAAMRREGHLFYCSANGVWLTDLVPPQFLTFPEEHQ